FNAREDLVELRFAHQKCVVLRFYLGMGFDEVQGQVITELNDGKGPENQRRIETQHFTQERCRRIPVSGSYDRVVQLCWHTIPFSMLRRTRVMASIGLMTPASILSSI